MYHPFSIWETVKSTWTVLRQNFATLVIYSIVSLFIVNVVDFITDFIFVGDTFTSRVIVFFVVILIQSYVTLSFYKLILTLMDRQYYEFEFKDIWPSFKMAYTFAVVWLIYIIIGGVLFVINKQFEEYEAVLTIIRMAELGIFIYLLIRSLFCVCFIVDEESNVIESLQQSFSITRDNFFKTMFMGILILGFMIVILIPIIFIVGLIKPDNGADNSYQVRLSFYIWMVLVFPTVQVLIMTAYRRLVYSHKDIDDDVAETN